MRIANRLRLSHGPIGPPGLGPLTRSGIHCRHRRKLMPGSALRTPESGAGLHRNAMPRCVGIWCRDHPEYAGVVHTSRPSEAPIRSNDGRSHREDLKSFLARKYLFRGTHKEPSNLKVYSGRNTNSDSSLRSNSSILGFDAA